MKAKRTNHRKPESTSVSTEPSPIDDDLYRPTSAYPYTSTQMRNVKTHIHIHWPTHKNRFGSFAQLRSDAVLRVHNSSEQRGNLPQSFVHSKTSEKADGYRVGDRVLFEFNEQKNTPKKIRPSGGSQKLTRAL